MFRLILVLLCSQLLAFTVISYAAETDAAAGKQSIITPKQPAPAETPLVVIYTLSSCPHCLEAKEYLSNHKIPFVNREVDTDEEQMGALMKIYDSMGVPEHKRGVPLMVIGNRIKLQGFNSDKLQQALKEVTSTPKGSSP